PFTVNRTQVTDFGENVNESGCPPSGSAPTAMLEPSLNDSVPDVTLSVVLVRSWSVTRATETGLPQVSVRLALGSPWLAHSLPRSRVSPSTKPSIAAGASDGVKDEDAVAVAVSAMLLSTSSTQKNSFALTNAYRKSLACVAWRLIAWYFVFVDVLVHCIAGGT